MERLAITWQLSDFTGWGVFGSNLVAELLARGRPRPMLLTPPDLKAPDPLWIRVLEPLVREQNELAEALAVRPSQLARLGGTLVLHHLGNGLKPPAISARVEGERNAGMVFLESARLSAEDIAQAARFDRILAGSTWNAELLKARGLSNVRLALQGIDPILFHPCAGGKRLFKDRFVVFSGGKLEYRKGQDIVLAAFRRFAARRPDALLMTAWHNPWPASVTTIARSPHVRSAPEIGADGRPKLADWVAAHGLGRENFIDLGQMPHAHLPPLLRHADAAVFANRAEGGTNLVAMECLALGIPCVISANTGHGDLLTDPPTSRPLGRQTPVPGGDETEGWGESDVEELLAHLDALYTDRAAAERLGERGAAMMREWTWAKQVGKLLSAARD